MAYPKGVQVKVKQALETLEGKLNKRYNTTYFKRYTHEDGADCIAIGDLTVAMFDVFSLNQTYEYMKNQVYGFCDLNIQLIRNAHKKIKYKIFKGRSPMCGNQMLYFI